MTAFLPKKLRTASPEEIAAYRVTIGRKAKQSSEDCRTLFRLRMQREEREGELDALIAKYRDEGKSRRQAIYAAMRDMGYRGAEKERREFDIAKCRGMVNRRRQKQSEAQKKYKARMRNKDLDAAMDTLKPNAPPEQEMDWVVGHRKLFHAAQNLSDEEAEPIKVVAADLRDAPSQAAVTMLMVALQDPVDWMKKKRDAHKSKTGAGGGGEDDTSDVEDDLTEVERMLKVATADG